MDITKIRQEMIRIAKAENPDALDYRIDVGEGADYVSALYSNDLGEFESSIHIISDDNPPTQNYYWISLGIWSDDVEKRLADAA